MGKVCGRSGLVWVGKHTHTHTHTQHTSHTNTHIQTHTHTHTHTHTEGRPQRLSKSCQHCQRSGDVVRNETHTHIHSDTDVMAITHTDTQTQTRTCTQTHTHTHTYTHTRSGRLSESGQHCKRSGDVVMVMRQRSRSHDDVVASMTTSTLL